MADGRAQYPFAVAARPSCDDGDGRVCACAYPVAGTVERWHAAPKVAGPSGDEQPRTGGDQDGKVGFSGNMSDPFCLECHRVFNAGNSPP